MELKPAPGPAERARDQIGLFFYALSVPLACGVVAAARAPRAEFLRHTAWWWTGFALCFLVPALCFTVIPWAMRRVYGIAPGGAVVDATRGFYALVAATLAMGALDFAVATAGLKGPAGWALGRGAAPAILVAGMQVVFRGKGVGWG
ncbi:MAG: hypothetical protein HYY18_02465, partial [Planctomycetes bacterium]|nr:hypothetical protein [Planctomycetota bacterium]